MTAPEHPVRSYYRRTASVYDATRWTFLYDRRFAVRALELAAGDAILEIGAGTGHNVSAFSDAVGPGGQVTLLDFSLPMLRRALTRKAGPGACRVDHICADGSRFVLRRTYDAILFSYSLSLIPDRQAALQAAIDHLEPGGRLCVLDFGRMDRWGPLRWGLRWWLGRHSVQPIWEDLVRFGSQLENFRIDGRKLGWTLIAVGHRAS